MKLPKLFLRNSSSRPVLAVSLGLIVACMPVMIELAQAQQQRVRRPTLLEMIFRKPGTNHFEPQIEEKVEIKRVSAPKYFTYRPEKMVKLPFKGLKKVAVAKLEALQSGDAVPLQVMDDQGNNLDEIAASNADTPVTTQSIATDNQQSMVSELQQEEKPSEASVLTAEIEPEVVDQANELKNETGLEKLDRGPVVEIDPSILFLTDVFGAQPPTIKATKAIVKAVVDFYQKSPRFLWVSNGKVNGHGQAVLALMEYSDQIGLEPFDYLVRPISEEADASERVRFELAMSVAAVRYALDDSNGRVNPNRLSGYHDFPKPKYTAAQAIQAIAAAEDPATYLSGLTRDSKQFLALKAELKRLHTLKDDLIVIPDGTLIKPGRSHKNLPLVISAIRKNASQALLWRHGETLSNYSRTELFTPELVALVKDFQKEQKLTPDGVVGRNTISKLSDVSSQVKINRVLYAMERLRWHPRDFGKRYVFINQPAFRARYYNNGNEALSMRVIVGKRSNQTSFFYDTIETVEYNPYWGVPQSIIVNEMLPKLRANPAYFDEKGYELSTPAGQRISSTSVNWNSVGSGTVNYNVRQLPGPRNALGELKILFPNKHHIYMHDTPSRGLFKRDQRALSHGCVRLHDPKAMAAAVLGTSVSHIKSKINLGKNQAEKLPQKIPVYVAYFTAWPDEAGKVEYFNDIYGRDKHLGKALDKVVHSRAAT